MVAIKRFDVCVVNLDPTIGSEIKKTRPCVVISPDSMNCSRLRTIIVAPMTSTVWENFPTRIDVKFQQKKGQIALDQIRTIDRKRLVKKVGNLPKSVCDEVLSTLQVLFS